MSYLSNALVRLTEQRGLIQADICRQTGLSRAHTSRIFNGESQDLSDRHFAAVTKIFNTDPQAQAELVAARCMDTREGARAAGTAAADLVEIKVRSETDGGSSDLADGRHANVQLSRETEKAFSWLRSQCPVNPDLEKHLVGYARMLGMK